VRLLELLLEVVNHLLKRVLQHIVLLAVAVLDLFSGGLKLGASVRELLVEGIAHGAHQTFQLLLLALVRALDLLSLLVKLTLHALQTRAELLLKGANTFALEFHQSVN